MEQRIQDGGGQSAVFMLQCSFLFQPCPDVYWFPLFKEIYATHLVEVRLHQSGYGFLNDCNLMMRMIINNYDLIR